MNWKRRIPGVMANGIAWLATGLWVYWGTAEMYYEGWWGAWYNRVFYLIPGGVFLAMTLIAQRWPRAASWLLYLLGGGFSVFWLGEDIVDNHRIDWRDMPVYLMLGGEGSICHCSSATCVPLIVYNNLNDSRAKVIKKGQYLAVTDAAACDNTGDCTRVCHFGARTMVEKDGQARLRYQPSRCFGCGLCAHVCPNKAIDMVPRKDAG